MVAKTKARTNLGETLLFLRKRKSLSQAAIAVRVGVARTVYQRIEMRPDQSSVMTLRKVCRELGEPLSKVMKMAEDLAASYKRQS